MEKYEFRYIKHRLHHVLLLPVCIVAWCIPDILEGANSGRGYLLLNLAIVVVAVLVYNALANRHLQGDAEAQIDKKGLVIRLGDKEFRVGFNEMREVILVKGQRIGYSRMELLIKLKPEKHMRDLPIKIFTPGPEKGSTIYDTPAGYIFNIIKEKNRELSLDESISKDNFRVMRIM